MLESGDRPSKIVEERGLKQTSDTGAIDAEIDQVLAANADKVAEYKAGKQALFGFFVGQTMKAMQGKANPQLVNERLRAKLELAVMPGCDPATRLLLSSLSKGRSRLRPG